VIATETAQDPRAERRRRYRAYQKALRKNFLFFLAEIWRYNGLPKPSFVQLDVAYWLQNGPVRRGIRGFRGLSKTWITCAYILWRLHKNNNERILLVSKSGGEAKKSLFMIRGWINSVPFLRYLAPRREIKHGPNRRKWRDSATMFDVGPSEHDRSPSLAAIGIEGQLPGIRATLIVPDDVETKENTITHEQRKRLREQVEEFEAILVPAGDVVYLGTPHHEDTLYDYLAKSADLQANYVFRTWPVQYPREDEHVPWLAPALQQRLDDETALPGDPTWPERFSKEHLLGLAVSRTSWLMQFMLVSDLGSIHRYPLKLDDLIVFSVHRDRAPISLAWGQQDSQGSTYLEDIPSVGLGKDGFRRPIFVHETWKPFHGCKGFLDPSGRGEDEMAWAIVAQLHGSLFVKWVDGVQGGATTENLEKIVASLRDHDCRELYVETNYGGDMLIMLLEPIIAKFSCRKGESKIYPDGWSCTVLPYHATGQKETRIIDAIEPVANQHRLVVSHGIVHDTTLWHQFTRITRERNCLDHDDRLDALAGAVAQWKDWLHQDATRIAALSEEEEADAAAEYWRRKHQNLKRPRWIHH